MYRHAVATLALFALAGPALAQDIGGNYAIRGTSLDGSPYGGSARIVRTSESTCEIYWTTGPTTSQGICMRNGNAFSAGYVMGEAVGLVIYEVMPDGSLEGL